LKKDKENFDEYNLIDRQVSELEKQLRHYNYLANLAVCQDRDGLAKLQRQSKSIQEAVADKTREADQVVSKLARRLQEQESKGDSVFEKQI
jgi:hypothetical protein